MPTMAFHRYRPYPPLALPDRIWPNRTITHAPTWCSVDLRDGNQALAEPMDPATKLRLFDLLVAMGFKEIEVGFPAASETDHDFVRRLIDDRLIPDDVTIQVLTQSREDLIEQTFASIRGAHRAIVHLYNSTSTLQRRVVFNMDKAETLALAVRGVRHIRQLADEHPETEFTLEYSPESFTGTEIDFSVAVCEAVMDEWEPTAYRPLILNLPATVELSTPNVYADIIEWFCRHLSRRDHTIISVHPHNDRGCAVAAAELALLAGADRVEGTLFGNGERTGNVDLITLALNLFSKGIDPQLDLCDINEVARVAEDCTQLPIHPRHPYAGELVFTAFSGSHQDAIKKGLAALKASGSSHWEVPYLPVDPADLGRTYQGIIRITSQSGKGGPAYLLEQQHGLQLPRDLQLEFGRIIKRESNTTGKELTGEKVWRLFEQEYLAPGRMQLIEHEVHKTEEVSRITATVAVDGEMRSITGTGNGPIDAFVDALANGGCANVDIVGYWEHATGTNSDATAAAYIRLRHKNGETTHGVGLHADSAVAPLLAIISAINRMSGAQQ